VEFVKLVRGSPVQPDTSFLGGVQQERDQKTAHDASRLMAEKHLYSALHAVKLRMHQLQAATLKAQPHSRRGAINYQLNNLENYFSALNSISAEMESGSKTVCHQAYLSTISHFTGLIQHSLHYNHHEDHLDAHHDMASLMSHMNNTQTMQLLTAREQELDLMLGIGLTMQRQTKDVKAASSDFGVVVLTAAAMESNSSGLLKKAEETLLAEVREEVKMEASEEGITMDAKAEERIVRSKTYERWEIIKTKAAEIHAVASAHWNSRDEKIAAMRNAFKKVYADMVQPHLDRWHKTAKAHGETFSASLESMNTLASSLDNAIQSYPASEADALGALHENIASLVPQCDECTVTLGKTMKALYAQKDAIVKAKEELSKAMLGDASGLKELSAVLDMDQMKAAIGEIGNFHDEHLPGMDTVITWLTSSIDSVAGALNNLGISSGKEAGSSGNHFTA
jgi:hypothetical protein